MFVFIWQILSLAFEMMGLGNGRRTMKSPPFVLAALVACNIVLGFNYWIASSRSVDLQVFACLFCLCGCRRRGVPPAGCGLHAAQDDYECGPRQNCKFT